MSAINKSLAAVVANLKAKYPYMSMGTDEIDSEIEDSVSTGCIPLDVILSSPSNPNGGIPMGRLVEVFGGESEGKTTLSESIVAANCRKGGYSLLVLSEGSIDKNRLQAQGVDLSRVITLEVTSIEEGFTGISDIIAARDEEMKKVPFFVIWDTISQCGTSTGSGGMTEIPRIMHQMKRKYSGAFSRSGIGFLVVNQVFDTFDQYHPTQSASGGRAIRFWASLRLELKRVGWLDGKTGREGIWVNVNIFKSKICVPFRSVRVPIKFISGIDNDLAMWYFLKEVHKKIFRTAGPWHKYTTPMGDERNFHFEDFPDIMELGPEAFVPQGYAYGKIEIVEKRPCFVPFDKSKTLKLAEPAPVVVVAVPPNNGSPAVAVAPAEEKRVSLADIVKKYKDKMVLATFEKQPTVDPKEGELMVVKDIKDPFPSMREYVTKECWNCKNWSDIPAEAAGQASPEAAVATE